MFFPRRVSTNSFGRREHLSHSVALAQQTMFERLTSQTGSYDCDLSSWQNVVLRLLACVASVMACYSVALRTTIAWCKTARNGDCCVRPVVYHFVASVESHWKATKRRLWGL